MTPPPGWYRDPSAPSAERWWDGTAWTGHRRTPGAPPLPPAGPGTAAPVPAPAAGGGPGRAKGIVLVAAGAVLVASVVTGAVALNGGDGGAARGPAVPATTAGTAPASGTTAPPSSGPSAGASGTPVVVDDLNGITLPVLDGWEEPRNVSEDDVVLTTPGTYDCPGDPGLCRHGKVFSRTVTGDDETDPRALAEADIEEAADRAYDRDALGLRPYGGIESHALVGRGQVAVAGRAGYFVRWRVTTAAGPGGYVQSLAFPSGTGSQAPVVVRFVLDAGPGGPPLADMDRITEGIRPVGDADTGGGVGSSVGPSR